jgi:exodeoxyribonuclease V gamma subunit
MAATQGAAADEGTAAVVTPAPGAPRYRGVPEGAGLEAGDQGGLIILRASRAEALIGPLRTLLRQTQPDNVLAPQTVIAAHPGMKQWLVGALARHDGPAGIVANLDLLLPSAWVDRFASEQLGVERVSPTRYQRGHLRWTIHRLLESGAPGVTDPRVAAYLAAGAGAGEIGLRRFQLADRLAGIFSRYLVYRPDWIEAWGAGVSPFATRHCEQPSLRQLETTLLAPLWRLLEAELGPHRATAVRELCARLRRDAPALPPLHVFGISHLPPAEMQVLRAYARHAPVMLYVPDPCREYWGGLVAGDDPAAWIGYRADESARIDRAGEGDYWHEQGHPLLSRWGRMGQHFLAGLADGEIREDQRHWQDEIAQVPGNRLERLQESVRQLRPQLLCETAIAAGECGDASLRIHACHTRLRELEVLRDALLDAIESQRITAGDIVVMAPDIRAYAALIPSVFGEAGSARERLLPYHLADVPLASSHVLFNTFARLLGLAASRVSTPEVVDFLSVPEVQRRTGLDAAALEDLIEWLRQSKVAWGLDARHRAGFGVPAAAEHTFAWAMDRMIAGYLMSDSPEDACQRGVTLPDGCELLPVSGIHGPGAAALGALDHVLRELQHWQELAGKLQPASRWAAELQLRLDALLQVDLRDEDARAAWSAISRMLAALASEPAAAGEDPLLHFDVVRELLLDALAGVPERQPFLMGGITFCGMVPQRAIPFAVVCVLGLDEGAFPRSQSDAGLDLTARLRRIGDRDVRTDDRYLFLETVMSARARLHLSYIGEGVKDGKPRNPAAPLAELMAMLDAAAGLDPEAGDDRRPWLLRHPLQPFDPRYFSAGNDRRLFTYQARFARMCGDGSAQATAFLADGTVPCEPIPRPLPLATLTHYFKDPARNLLERRLHLSLEALGDDALAGSEPLDPELPPIHAVARSVFFDIALPGQAAGTAWNRDGIPDWVRLSGMLPTGRLGVEAWAYEAAAVAALLAALADWPSMAGGVGASPRPTEVDLALDAFDPALPALRLVGSLPYVYPLVVDGVRGLQLVRAFLAAKKEPWLKPAGELHFGDRLPLFIEWAALRLHTGMQSRAAGEPMPPVRLVVLAKDAAGLDLVVNTLAWDECLLRAAPTEQTRMLATLARSLAALVDFWHDAQRQPPWYFPRTSWQALLAAREIAASADDGVDPGRQLRRKVTAAWAPQGGDRSGERDYAPGYTAMLAGELEFGDDDSDPDGARLDALLATAERLTALMTLHLPEESA